MMLKKGSISSYIVVSLLSFLSVTTVNAINPDFDCSRDCVKNRVCAKKGGLSVGQCFSDNTCQCYCANDKQQKMTPAGTGCLEGKGAGVCQKKCLKKGKVPQIIKNETEYLLFNTFEDDEPYVDDYYYSSIDTSSASDDAYDDDDFIVVKVTNITFSNNNKTRPDYGKSTNSWCADWDNTYACRCDDGIDYDTDKTCTPDVDQAQCTKPCRNYCATKFPQWPYFWYSKCHYNGGDSRCVCHCDADEADWGDGEIMINQRCGQDGDGLEAPIEGILADFKSLWEQSVGPLVCFSSETTVSVENPNQSGTTVRKISDIVAGDRVLTKNGQYETVYAIDHKEKYRPSNFVQIYHEQQKQPLEITKNHMVFLSARTNDEVVASAAEMVKVGDKLQTISGPSTVTKIDTVVRNGLFNPLTASGSIVVNQGVVASTFSSYELQNGERTQQSMMEKIVKPYQLACTSIGISLNWCQATGKLSEEKTLISRWAANAYGFWRNQKNETIRTILFSSVMTMTNIFDIIFSKTFTLLLVTLVLITRKIALLSASKN